MLATVAKQAVRRAARVRYLHQNLTIEQNVSWEKEKLVLELDDKKLARELDEKKLALELDDKKLARELELDDKKLARELDEKKLALELNDKKLAREFELDEKKNAREHELKLKEMDLNVVKLDAESKRGFERLGLSKRSSAFFAAAGSAMVIVASGVYFIATFVAEVKTRTSSFERAFERDSLMHGENFRSLVSGGHFPRTPSEKTTVKPAA